MTKRPPPVPPENRSDKGPATTGRDNFSPDLAQPDPRQENGDQQGRQENIRQNTTHQGHQQNR